MADDEYSDDELLAFVDEQLAVETMSAIEAALRGSEVLRLRMAELLQRRDSGEHSVGEIWRRGRLSCPSRAVLGSYLLGVLEPAQADYIRFHLQTIGCRFCQATVDELGVLAANATTTNTQSRRTRIFESSVGQLAPASSTRNTK